MSLKVEADALSVSSASGSEIASESVEGSYGCMSETSSVAPAPGAGAGGRRALSPKMTMPGHDGVPTGTAAKGILYSKSPSCHDLPRRSTPKRQAPLPPSAVSQSPSAVPQSPSAVPQQLPRAACCEPEKPVEAKQQTVHNLNQLVSHPVVVVPKHVPPAPQRNFSSHAATRNINTMVTKHIDDDSDSDTTMSESFSEHHIFARPQIPLARSPPHQMPYAQQHSPRQVFHEPLGQTAHLPSHTFISSRLIEEPVTVINEPVTQVGHLEDAQSVLRNRSRRIAHSSSDPAVSLSPRALTTRQPSRQPMSPLQPPRGLDHLSEEEGPCEVDERQALIPSRYDVTESVYRSPRVPTLQRTDSTVTVAHINEDVLVSSRLRVKVTLTNLTVVIVIAALVLPNTAQVLYTAFRLAFGTLFPAYYSYKAVRTKDVKEYVKWMMYWIVLAFFSLSETVTDLLFGYWIPFYYEMKMVVVLWLLSPATKGSSILYRQLIHPWLSRQEENIDTYIARAKQQGYSTLLQFGKRAVNWATTAFVTTAVKGTTTLAHHLRHSIASDGSRLGAKGRRVIAKRPEKEQTGSPLFQDLSEPYETASSHHDYDETHSSGGPIIRELSESPDGSVVRDLSEPSGGPIIQDVSEPGEPLHQDVREPEARPPRLNKVLG